MLDDMQKRIVDAAMKLIIMKGYDSTTTKDIAVSAKINESTIFRKFKSKKDIVLLAMKDKRWNPNLKDTDFNNYTFDLNEDLIRFAKIYMSKITPEMIKLSIGLRTPKLYEDTKNEILKVPQTFKSILIKYFQEMADQGKIKQQNFEYLATMFLSLIVGFIFLKGSFETNLIVVDEIEYIENSVKIFCNGLEKEKLLC